jgi:carboxyl-terminal processing protease
MLASSMKRSLTSLLFCSFILSVNAQPAKNYHDEAVTLKNILLEHHVYPSQIDDRFSSWVFDHYVKTLDPDKLYFTQDEIAKLQPLKTKLDDELNGKSWNFLPQMTAAFENSILRAKNITDEALKDPVSFNEQDFYSKDTAFASSTDELKKRWRKKIKYEMLTRFFEMQNANPAGGNLEFLKANENSVRQRVRAAMIRSFNKLLQPPSGFQQHLATVYLQSLAVAFDPHSNYLSSTAVENFIASMSSEGYYFGLVLDENENGEIVIDQLTPGGPAWKSGVLNGGDVIRKLAWEGQEALDLEGVSLDEVQEMLLDKNHDVLEFTVSKTGGVPQTVSLRKEKMESDENIVKSFILMNDGKKIGYISLPGFYTNWGEEGAARCANDVAREIIKLKKENIQGLILDLRFNGGGSLMEAVSMAGIFIDAGPVGIVKNKNGEMTTLKDMNRGTVYDGPLVLMVNSFSASASEFLAAALQDHQRAIIVGSTTYGKATAQRLLPVDKKIASQSTAQIRPGVGFTSVTMEKIYRITGKTAQSIGVAPDITIPDVFELMPIHERNLPRILASDSINKKTYFQPLPAPPLKSLSLKSADRINKKPEFQETQRIASYLAEQYHKTRMKALNWESFKKQAQQDREMMRLYLTGTSGHAVFTVGHHAFESQRMAMDSFFADLNKAWVKKLSRDFSLAEGFQVICDYIDLQKK